MRKCYLFLMTLFVQLIVGGSAFAADPPKSEYDAAMAAITDGAYYITTEVEGTKFYLGLSGDLTIDDASAGLFTVTQVSGGALYSIGLNINPGTGGHFSNTTLTNDKANLKPGTGAFRLDTSNDRNDWERQVPFMNEEGKIAIRSCNTAYGESSWADAGRAFWTYDIVNTDGIISLDPCYSYEPAYVWSFEPPTEEMMISMNISNLYDTYVDYIGDEFGDMVNLGTDPGQCRDAETYAKFQELLDQLDTYYYKLLEDPDFDPIAEGLDLDAVNTMKTNLDSLLSTVRNSVAPYTLPDGDGYYRIIAHNRYKSTYDESGFVDKAMAASFSPDHKDKGIYGTIRRDLANYIWKLEQHGDSIAIQNAGMETYISFASDNPDSKVIMTENPEEASHVIFDYAYEDIVLPNGEEDYRDIFAIRLAGKKFLDNRYIHQQTHSSVAEADESISPWGNLGVDTGVDQELGFWMRTFDAERTTDKNTSEWYLEKVPDEEVAQLLEEFELIKNHDLLVAENNALRAEVLAAMTTAKDLIRTQIVTSAEQMSSPYSDPSEGQNIGALIDGDAGTFWHSTWHGLAEGVDPFYYYGDGYEEGLECHYIQYSDMENAVGDMELYLRERDGADNDRVKTLVIVGADNLKTADEDWEVIAKITLPNTDKGQENTVPFTVETAYPYWRLFVIETASSSYAFRQFWHAAEIQFNTVQENPNSQFAALGEVAETLEATYDANVATPDDQITKAIYDALLDAFRAFMAAMVDPAEMRNAMAATVNVTKGIEEGTNPGYWADASVAADFDALRAEVNAYDKAGRYNAVQIHKYAVMLKAMEKSVMEKANPVETDKWYRIMFPTEEMYDKYGFGKDGGDNCNELGDDQRTMWGTFVTVGAEVTEENTEINEDGEEVTTSVKHIVPVALEDVREDTRMFFAADEEIEEPDLSMFRFVEVEPAEEANDYVAPFADTKENMALALDMNTTYTQGEPLITQASQFSSNASYPGNDGQKLETGCLIDNNFSTYWHSDYGRTYCCIPYLQVALNEPVSGLIQVYVGRRNTANGHVTRMYVQGSNDAETWTNIGYIELPYTNATTPATSQALDLGGTFSHLRFSMTQRYGTDGGSNIEFDPFDETITADDYNTKYTYFHASEFQIYPVTADAELSASGKALQQAYTTANKVVLKDATAEDLAAAAQAYRAYRTEVNAAEGKDILPYGIDKAQPTYAIQNKATGLFVYVSGTGNQNNLYMTAVPTLINWKAIGYQRSLLIAKNVEGTSCNNLHAGESNRRFCTWGTTEPATNSGLVICEADEEYAAPAEFTFFRDIKPGAINDWCSSVDLVNKGDGIAYTPVGQYTTEDEGTFLALNEVETIPAGEPAFYIFSDTTNYDAEDEYVEPMQFTIPGDSKVVTKGAMLNGVTGYLANHTLIPHEIYFSGNVAKCIGTTGYYVSAPCAVLDIDNCPEVDPFGTYDFSIFLGGAAKDAADGIKDISSTIEKISQRGNVYSMDGKLLMTGANLNSLKTLGRGMYILNGVKVSVK